MPLKRQAGVCLHLSSLPGDYGIGELGANAHRFIDTLTSMGLGVWQFLPIGPSGYADSPYQSPSAYAGNPLLIDLGALRDQGLVKDYELSSFEALSRDKVDFRELLPLKTQLLMRAAERFETSAPSAQRLARDEFVTANDPAWLHDYALFEVLRAMHQQCTWTDWDEPYAMRDPAALRKLEKIAWMQLENIKSVQFLFFEQWRKLHAYAKERGIRLMGDLPIYVALNSADAWANPELLQLGENRRPICIAGVPPDYFSEEGQRWDNPLYDWERHAADGYQWWVARVRYAANLADFIRLDHFRGLESYWAVPVAAETAREGEWRPGPADALLDALRDAMGTLPIIAEDLGIMTPEVEALRDRHGLAGMKALQFMVTEEGFDPGGIPENCACYTGTHDNDTTVGWFHNGLAGNGQAEEGMSHLQSTVLWHAQGCPETIHQDMIRLAFSTQAALAIATMQDYLGLGSQARMNTPGTTYGNWGWRLQDGQVTPQVREWVQQALSDSGRGGTPA